MAKEYNPTANCNRISGERVRTLYSGIAGGLAAICLGVTFGQDAVGTSGTQLPRAEQEQKLISEVQESFEEASVERKYEISFIAPIIERSDRTHTDSHGIRALLPQAFDAVTIRAGRSCLRNTVYDTKQDAEFKFDGKEVTIDATKTDAASLTFTVGESGALVPSRQTADAIKAYYNCRYLGGVPVRTSFSGGDDTEWEYKGSLLDQ